jgi:hypothetical protein
VKLLNYLNASGSGLGLQTILANLELGDGQQTLHLEALVINRDLTGDTTPDVLVEVIHPGWNMGNLLVFVCNAGRYEMDRLWVDWNWLYEGLRDVLDMNRDGIPEIVFTWDEGAAHGGIHFFIMEWNGNGFQSLAEPGGTYGDPGIWAGDGVITDADGNGTIDLLLSGDWTPGYGPGRTRHELWAWNGVAFTFHRSYYDPPVYRFQAVYDGDSASDTGQYDAALASYQSAIFDEKLLGWGPGQDPFDPQPGAWEPGERPRLEAYSRYRILLLHAVQNHWTEGQTLYETLQGKFPAGTEGHPFAELASEFWLAFEASRSIANACAKAINYASTHADEITAPISWPAYGDNEIRRYMPDDVCPFK